MHHPELEGQDRKIAVRRFAGVWSPELRNRRSIDVYLPASYPVTRRRYPVIYMQDGQNLSDPAIAFAGTWNLGAVLEKLASEGLEAIVVGVHHAGERRLAEYSPFRDSRHDGGAGGKYLQFIARTLKARIDRRFRTLSGRETTAIAGSSMGGLISLFAFFRYPRVFGRAAVMSPALWFGDGRIFEFIERTRSPRGRLYLDVGTHEGAGALRDIRRMHRLLVAEGYSARVMRYVEAEGAPHSESAWSERLPDALRFLLG